MRLLPNSSFTEESIYFCFKIKVLLKDFMCFFSQIATSLEGFVCVCSQITPLLQEFLHLMNHLVLHIPTCSHMSVHISTMVFSTILKPLWVVYLATTNSGHTAIPNALYRVVVAIQIPYARSCRATECTLSLRHHDIAIACPACMLSLRLRCTHHSGVWAMSTTTLQMDEITS